MTELGITGTGEIVTEDELRDRLTAELDAMEPAPPTATARHRPPGGRACTLGPL
jgi:hypothetical protein